MSSTAGRRRSHSDVQIRTHGTEQAAAFCAAAPSTSPIVFDDEEVTVPFRVQVTRVAGNYHVRWYYFEVRLRLSGSLTRRAPLTGPAPAASTDTVVLLNLDSRGSVRIFDSQRAIDPQGTPRGESSAPFPANRIARTKRTSATAIARPRRAWRASTTASVLEKEHSGAFRTV